MASPRACLRYRARTKGKDERMVGYIKGNFFVRYRAFDSWAHLNQLAEQWLVTEADQRLHGTVKEVVAERFEREQPLLLEPPAVRYDTSYFETRQVSWDGYIEVRETATACPVTSWGGRSRCGLALTIIYASSPATDWVASHRLRNASEGWVTVGEHHGQLWREALQVERRSLATYQEAAAWSD